MSRMYTLLSGESCFIMVAKVIWSFVRRPCSLIRMVRTWCLTLWIVAFPHSAKRWITLMSLMVLSGIKPRSWLNKISRHSSIAHERSKMSWWKRKENLSCVRQTLKFVTHTCVNASPYWFYETGVWGRISRSANLRWKWLWYFHLGGRN